MNFYNFNCCLYYIINMTDVNLTDIVQKIVRLNELQEKLQERQQQLREIIDDIQNIKTEIEELI